jgi:uncharacterized RDD family membrane protein YckC
MEVIDQPAVEKVSADIYGSFWMRFAALLIDGVILTPITLGLTYFNVSDWKSTEVLVLLSLIGIIYKPFMEFQFGATVGKMALKLKVVNANFEKAELSHVLLRNIFHLAGSILSFLITLYIYQDPGFESVSGWTDYSVFTKGFIVLQAVTWMTSIITIVDGIVLIADNRKQSLHDKIGQTYVITQ